MRKILEKLTCDVLGPGAQGNIRIINEVVTRAVVRGILRGMAPKYVLRVHPNFSTGARYSYDVTMPGADISVYRMREASALPALKKSVATPEGKEDICRYLFSICAFMPKRREEIFHLLLSPSSPAYALREVVKNMCAFIDDVSSHAEGATSEHEVNWNELYKTCSKKLHKALAKMSEVAVVGVAYALYTSEACREITTYRDSALKLISGKGPVDPEIIPDLAVHLRLLSNFDLSLAEHFKIRRSVLHTKEESGGKIIYDCMGLMHSLKREGDWPHMINGKVSAQIRKSAAVTAEKLLLVSMLLNNEVGITTSNIGALLFSSGRVGYYHKKDMSFALLRLSSDAHYDLSDGLLSSDMGKELVDLLLESHHIRHRCSFGIDYETLAQEVRRLSDDIQGDGIILSSVVSNICEGLCQQGVARAAVVEHAKELAALIEARVEFLRNFVDHPQFKHFIRFIMQSSVLDTHVDFDNYLRDKAAFDWYIEDIRKKTGGRVVELKGLHDYLERRRKKRGKELEELLKEQKQPDDVVLARKRSGRLDKAMEMFGVFLMVSAATFTLYALCTYLQHGDKAVLGGVLTLEAVFILAFVVASLGFLCMSFACINMRRDAALEEMEPLKIRGDRPMLLDLYKCDVTQVRECPISASDMEAIDAIGCIGTASIREQMAEPVNENQEGVYADVLPSGDHSSRMSRSGRGGGVSR